MNITEETTTYGPRRPFQVLGKVFFQTEGGGNGTVPSRVCHLFWDNTKSSVTYTPWFWPAYNRAASPPSGNTIYYFRHFCLRGVLVNYNQDTNTVAVVQAYTIASDDDGIWWSFINPISWYFVPSAVALDELIAAASFSPAPPSSGTIRLSIYMEMHREYASVWETALGGGKHFAGGNSSANLVGDETTSVPAVLKVCWELSA